MHVATRCTHLVSFLTLTLPLTLSACGRDDSGGTSGHRADAFSDAPPSDVIKPEPGPRNTVMRLFVKPFAGEYPLVNYFDHDRPVAPGDTNGYQLTWRGERAYPGVDISGYDGHRGMDWELPQNTPVFAVTNGEVVFAGDETFPCFLQNNKVLSNPTVVLQFVAPDGSTYRALYTHLNRIDVAVGDVVAEGQQLGLSGATGCVGKARAPHLHFQVSRVLRQSPTEVAVIDPYGWEGPTPDPWEAGNAGRASVWLWKQGQAPDIVRR